VHAPNEEKSDDSKDSFHFELEQVFDHFPKYHMKIRRLMQKWGENISNRQLRMGVYIRTVMTMVTE
jgi:hypothetical protein